MVTFLPESRRGAGVRFDAEFLLAHFPFERRWLRVRGAQMHYIDEGAGEPMVFVHGNPTWSFYFRGLIAGLRDERRCVAPDHVGCGLSDRPNERDYEYTLERRVEDLETLLDRLDLSRITLVVHDWGGMIGLCAALRRPERIARIVVLNSAAFLMPPGKRLPPSLWFIKRTPVLPALLVRGLNLFARRAASVCVTRPMSPTVREAYVAPYDSWRSSLATLRFVEDIPVSPRDRSYALAKWTDANLERLRDRPMLICWGGRDFIFDAPILAEWRRRFPRGEVQAYPEAGHYVLEDAGEQVLARIRDFLARTPLRSEVEQHT